MNKKQVQNLIGKNKLTEVIRILMDHFDQQKKSELKKDLLQLSARLDLITKQERQGTLKGENITLEFNQIRLGLIELADRLSEPLAEQMDKDEHQVPTGMTSSRFYLYAVCLMGIIILSAYYLWPVKRSSIEAAITADAISVKLAEKWELDTLMAVKSFEAQNLSTLSGLVETSILTNEGADLWIVGEYIYLSQLKIPAGSTVSLLLDKDDIIMSVTDGEVEGKLDLAKANLQIPQLGIDQFIPSTVPEILTYTTNSYSQYWLTRCDSCVYKFNDLVIDSISFLKLVQLDPPLLESSIYQGKYYLNDNAIETELENKVRFSPQFITSGRINLQIKDNIWQILLESEQIELPPFTN